jgi:hypothetical protein
VSVCLSGRVEFPACLFGNIFTSTPVILLIRNFIIYLFVVYLTTPSVASSNWTINELERIWKEKV